MAVNKIYTQKTIKSHPPKFSLSSRSTRLFKILAILIIPNIFLIIWVLMLSKSVEPPPINTTSPKGVAFQNVSTIQNTANQFVIEPKSDSPMYQ